MILRKFLSLVLALCFVLTFSALTMASPAQEGLSWPERLNSLEAESAILMDGDTGQILFEKQGNKKMHPASITKILTALIVIENTQPTDTMTASATALNISSDSTSIDLQPGEKLTVEEGLYALMVASANDAANVLAEHVAGTQEEFAQLMNQRLGDIGALNSHFVNPHGLTARGHLTTAFDMALIMKEALNNPQFVKYFGVPAYTMDATNLNAEERELLNYHFMLREDLWAYNPEVIGGKVGFTNAAGNTLCTSGEKGGRRLLAVVLKSGGEGKFSDTQLLFDYGFSQFTSATIPTTDLESLPIPVLNNKGEMVKDGLVVLPQEVSLLLPAGTDPQQVVSRLSTPDHLREDNMASSTLQFYLLDGQEEFSQPLLELALEYEFILPPPLPQENAAPLFSFPWAPVYVFLAVAVGLVLFLFVLLRVLWKRKQLPRSTYHGYYR